MPKGAYLQRLSDTLKQYGKEPQNSCKLYVVCVCIGWYVSEFCNSLTLIAMYAIVQLDYLLICIELCAIFVFEFVYM